MTLSHLNLILVPSVLALSSPAWAEARQANAKTGERPLNLSLPHGFQGTPGVGQADEAVRRNLLAPEPRQNDTPAPARLPYGAGYEHRHQEMGVTAPGGAGVGAGSNAGQRGR